MEAFVGEEEVSCLEGVPYLEEAFSFLEEGPFLVASYREDASCQEVVLSLEVLVLA